MENPDADHRSNSQEIVKADQRRFRWGIFWKCWSAGIAFVIQHLLLVEALSRFFS